MGGHHGTSWKKQCSSRGNGEVYSRPVEALDYDFNLSKLERVMSGAGKNAALGHELERRGVEGTIVGTGENFCGAGLALKKTGGAGGRGGGRVQRGRAH